MSSKRVRTKYACSLYGQAWGIHRKPKTGSDPRAPFGGNRDTGYWYYATQATFNVQGSYWRRWNQAMSRLLTQQQIKHGAESGSWDPRLPVQDQWASAGGRLYVTCLSICMLEVYYRHLPVYSDAASGR